MTLGVAARAATPFLGPEVDRLAEWLHHGLIGPGYSDP